MKLIIPVYLNQSNVFDLLAMLKGGLATVTSVQETKETEASSQDKMGAGFGLGSAFSSLLKVDMSAEKGGENKKASGSILAEERVHTPASLLFQLISELDKNKLLKSISDTNLAAGDIVEFESVLSKNPMLESLHILSQIFDVAALWEQPNHNNKKKGNQGSPNAQIKKQLQGVIDVLEAGDTFDLVGTIECPQLRSVITIDKNFLSDPQMSNLVEGKFKVLGKIIRNVGENDSPISLVRKSAIGKTPEILSALMNVFDTLADGSDFNMPKAETEVKGPAVHILPIAIYV